MLPLGANLKVRLDEPIVIREQFGGAATLAKGNRVIIKVTCTTALVDDAAGIP